MTCFILPVFAM